jgi:hypothetical protein
MLGAVLTCPTSEVEALIKVQEPHPDFIVVNKQPGLLSTIFGASEGKLRVTAVMAIRILLYLVLFLGALLGRQDRVRGSRMLHECRRESLLG